MKWQDIGLFEGFEDVINEISDKNILNKILYNLFYDKSKPKFQVNCDNCSYYRAINYLDVGNSCVSCKSKRVKVKTYFSSNKYLYNNQMQIDGYITLLTEKYKEIDKNVQLDWKWENNNFFIKFDPGFCGVDLDPNIALIKAILCNPILYHNNNYKNTFNIFRDILDA